MGEEVGEEVGEAVGTAARLVLSCLILARNLHPVMGLRWDT